jgi:hypothetical protein
MDAFAECLVERGRTFIREPGGGRVCMAVRQEYYPGTYCQCVRFLTNLDSCNHGED